MQLYQARRIGEGTAFRHVRHLVRQQLEWSKSSQVLLSAYTCYGLLARVAAEAASIWVDDDHLDMRSCQRVDMKSCQQVDTSSNRQVQAVCKLGQVTALTPVYCCCGFVCYELCDSAFSVTSVLMPLKLCACMLWCILWYHQVPGDQHWPTVRPTYIKTHAIRTAGA